MKAVSNYVLLLILALSGCSSLETVVKPTYNNGGYTFEKYKSKSLQAADSAVITGVVTTRRSDESSLISIVRLGCYSQQTGSDAYLFKVKPFDVRSQSKAIS
ncbi:hypothetical protein [Pontibacter akesuensis]|uniref:Uncharacterized protein n=1 Tax=Pontibacter akesuensis TaxID=388950 RepID=A0A1I7H786_9BACT|nr:hypothetical protein [Pontibacter akesuensis]GHA53049.1 hypothetical protein GCM10007389_00210 [Pontibacter akesuensis]SFU56356.1 hypothetical protein SAMN04487941_1560 [Pontibacter akesuensis]